jgi:hypothetical protein
MREAKYQCRTLIGDKLLNTHSQSERGSGTLLDRVKAGLLASAYE